MKNYTFDFYNSASLKSYNLNDSMRFQLSILDKLDPITKKHSENVASVTCRICEYLQCTPNDIMEIKFDSEIASSYNEKHKAKLEAQIAELQAKLKQM